MSRVNTSYAEVIVTVVGVEQVTTEDFSTILVAPTTRVFRMEFDTIENALNYIDTSNDPKGLVNVQEMGK